MPPRALSGRTRQDVEGGVLALLRSHGAASATMLAGMLQERPDRVRKTLRDLECLSRVQRDGRCWRLVDPKAEARARRAQAAADALRRLLVAADIEVDADGRICLGLEAAERAVFALEC